MKIILLSLILFISPAFSDNLILNQTPIQVCFTPGQNCTREIVNALDGAQQDIWVQAYVFTSWPIIRALIAARQRGVNVRVILDKTDVKYRTNIAQYFVKHKIPVWVDDKPVIAHNKVMVIDKTEVITGSFNFTKAAQDDNAENLLIIKNSAVATLYLHNWEKRLALSYPIAHKSTAGLTGR